MSADAKIWKTATYCLDPCSLLILFYYNTQNCLPMNGTATVGWPFHMDHYQENIHNRHAHKPVCLRNFLSCNYFLLDGTSLYFIVKKRGRGRKISNHHTSLELFCFLHD